jgi:5-methylcytosine-specific restriction endonuclease McrA
MRITKDFIFQHKTARGGWTAGQIIALGEKWPVQRGWISRAIEKEFTQEQIDRFIKSRDRDAVKNERKASRAFKVQLRKELRTSLSKIIPCPQNISSYARQIALSICGERCGASKNKVEKKNAVKPAIDPKSDAFLSSFQWRTLRMAAFKKYGNRCQCCGASPADGIVLNVDHVKPRKHHPELALDINNLQILCAACNHGKSNTTVDWRTQCQG